MYPTSHAATAAGAGVAAAVVFDNDDLVHLVLQHAALDPGSFVAVSCVNHAFRRVCQRDTGLLLAAAAGREYITTRALTGLMGVDAAEADALPRSMKNRPVDRGGGVIYIKPAVT